ncbi:MAG TPA: phosphoglycerate dehydrogenase, partial [Rhodoferax sp.]
MIQKSIASSTSKSGLKAVLLEGIHPSAVKVLQDAGYTHIVTHAKALSGDELISAISDAHFLGIRSGTQLTENV